MASKFTDVILTILVIAGITTVLLPGRGTEASKVLESGGKAFGGVIKAATGQK